jgi:signal transduction histidine kinase
MREIRLKLGQGIAGWVARERKTANVTSAYEDPRFHPEVDVRSGFRTRSVVAVPLTGREEELLGVLQVLNRRGGPFTEEDIDLLRAIAAQTAYAVENAHLAQRLLDQNQELEAARLRAERRRAELDLLYSLEQETAAATELEELLDSVIVQAAGRMRSEAGSVLLLDRNTGRLYFRGVAGSKAEQLKKISLEPGQGVVGWVAQNGEPLVVNHPGDDPRHDRNLASQIDFPAYALLAVPLVWNKRVIGAVEVLNPRPRSTGATGYDLEDLKVLTLIAGQVARAVTLTQERQAHIDTERLVVIGRMLTGVAHDLRNPMTAISGYAQLMAVEEEHDQREKRCDRILSQIDEMTAMIADLLAFARGDRRLNPGPIAVTKFAADVRDSLSLHCNPRGIQLTVEGSGGTAIIDAGRAKRIVYNLAKNAVDVLGKGGKLAIIITEAGGGMTIRVSDDGPGIPPSIQTNLFEPFVSAGKVNGTGLGLSIVQRFVDDQGGDIMVESSSEEGTTFVVRLPQAENGSVSQVSQ